MIELHRDANKPFEPGKLIDDITVNISRMVSAYNFTSLTQVLFPLERN